MGDYYHGKGIKIWYECKDRVRVKDLIYTMRKFADDIEQELNDEMYGNFKEKKPIGRDDEDLKLGL
jgi:hypothetical protein